MNPDQLATMEEAKTIAKQLATMGGGVKPVSEDPNESGIYVPTYYGPYAVPEIGDKKFLHFRFRNGAEGFNVGLVRTFIKLFPMQWPDMIGREVAAGARSDN